MSRLSATEVRQLAAGRVARQDVLRRASRELRDRRAADNLTPRRIASLQSVRAQIAELDGDHAAELEVLDLVLAGAGATPEPIEDPREADEEPGARPSPARRGRRWPHVD